MKKGVLILALFAMVTAGAFAQDVDVSLELRVSRLGSDLALGGFDYIEGLIPMPSVIPMPNTIPGLGVAIGMGSIEFLLDLEFWRVSDNSEYSVTGFTEEMSGAFNHFSIAAGAAPVVSATERLTLTFPIMLQFSRLSLNGTFSETDEYTAEFRFARNLFGINLGARTYFSLHQNWSVFLGAQIAAFTAYFTPTAEVRYAGVTVNLMENTTNRTVAFFHTGRVDLGVRFSF